MDAAVLGILGGAVLGFTASVLVAALRPRYDRAQFRYQHRANAYADYLTALTTTNARLQELSPGQRDQALEIWNDTQMHARRHLVEMIGPPSVRDAATASYRRLRDVRNAVSAGDDGSGEALASAGSGSADLVPLLLAFDASLDEMLTEMRADLG